jgi:hypothetical protein
MFSEPVTSEFAAQIESAEVNAWLDLYAAMPADFARNFQLEIFRVQNVVLTCCRTIPFVHFNSVINLGVDEPASEDQVDELLAIYHDANVRTFAIHHIPHCQPVQLPEWFMARNLRLRGGWERIYRNNASLATIATYPEAKSGVEKVTKETASEWANHIDATYGLPTKPWLLSLVERPGWHHYMLRKDTRIVAVRSMYVHHDHMAWLGIEAPVPGVMAPSYDSDFQICQTIVSEGITLGVKYFVADIEAPTAEMDTPAYHQFELLGFKRPYFRSHYGY